MNERPIAFSRMMMPSLLAGKKTQTRRPLADEEFGSRNIEPKCRYGVPGDRLWVREEWRTGEKIDHLNSTQMAFQAGEAGYAPAGELGKFENIYAPIWYEADGGYRQWGANDKLDFGEPGRLRVPRFMPRWASRVLLEIVSVRKEKLHDISEEDAVAEGIEPIPGDYGHNRYSLKVENGYINRPLARQAYRDLWELIYGPGTWGDNLTVWVVEFKTLSICVTTPTRHISDVRKAGV